MDAFHRYACNIFSTKHKTCLTNMPIKIKKTLLLLNGYCVWVLQIDFSPQIDIMLSFFRYLSKDLRFIMVDLDTRCIFYLKFWYAFLKDILGNGGKLKWVFFTMLSKTEKCGMYSYLYDEYKYGKIKTCICISLYLFKS